MLFSKFFELVEIRTKLASITPFLLGTVYSLYHYKDFNFQNFIIMFISLIAFDMATTAINNYCDDKKAKKIHGKNNKGKDIFEKYYMKESTILAIIFILLTTAAVFGVLLTYKTNEVVLLIGMISFLAGILYTFGPIPISRMPLGELFSGVFMGFIITFLSVYIHIYDQNIVFFIYKNHMLNISINMIEVFYIFLISIPMINGIANIMLANNICDMEEDIINRRYTLPYYIGKENALKLFKILYYIGYMDMVVLLLLRITPIITILSLVTLISVNKNIKEFCKRPIKSETFVLSVKNFVLINIPQILFIGIMIVMNY